MAERKAMRMGDKQMGAEWLKQLASHSKFFLILTAVFGTVSGVGIWFAIGLTHPEATSTLIHNFVFGWAMEWVFFIVELTTIAVYYYTWDRIPEKLHLTVGWVYAASSVCTLVINFDNSEIICRPLIVAPLLSALVRGHFLRGVLGNAAKRREVESPVGGDCRWLASHSSAGVGE